MCAVSMVGDYYTKKWPEPTNPFPQLPYPGYGVGPKTTGYVPSGPSQAEFDALKKEVMEMRELLKRAKAYDEATGQKDCEMEDKVAVLRKVADLVGVDLSEVFGPAK